MNAYVFFDLVFWASSDKYPQVELLGSPLSLVIALVLKSILSGISIAITAFFYFHFYKVCFSITLLSVCVSFNLK